MDSFNYLVTVILMMIGMQFGESWIAFAILLISILSSKDLPTILLLVFTGGILYYLKIANLYDYWLIVLIVLVGISFLFGTKQGGGQPDYYAPDPFGGLMGGGMVA